MSNASKGLTRQDVDAAVASEGSIRGAARQLGVHHSTVQGWLAKGADHEPSTAQRDFEEIPIIYRDYSHHDKHYVYPLGDVHIGSPAHAADVWQEWLDFLAEQRRPNSSLLGTGDFLNCAIKGSKSEVYDEVMSVGDAKRQLRAQLTPLAEKGLIDGLVPGNHENRIYRATGDCPILDVCDALGVTYIESAVLVVYQVGDVEYELFLRHGTGNSGGTIGSRATQLSRSGQVVHADIYVSGHVHNQLVARDRVFVRDSNFPDRMVSDRRIFMASGSFCGYERYAAERAYIAGDLGAPRIRLAGDRKDCHVSI